MSETKLTQSQTQKLRISGVQVMLNKLLVPQVDLAKAAEELMRGNMMVDVESGQSDDNMDGKVADVDDVQVGEEEIYGPMDAENEPDGDDDSARFDDYTDAEGDDEERKEEFNPIEEKETSGYDDDNTEAAQKMAESSSSSVYDIITEDQSLYGYLMSQVEEQDFTDIQRIIAQQIVGGLDDRGFLPRHLSLIANDLVVQDGIDVSDLEMEEVLKVVQTFEPAGVAARSEQECLQLQLDRMPQSTPYLKEAKVMMARYFNQFLNRNFQEIERGMSIDSETRQHVVELLKHLTISPGASFTINDRDTIIPDFYVLNQDGKLKVVLNDEELHAKVRMNKYYEELLDMMEEKQNRRAQENRDLKMMKEHKEQAIQFFDALKLRDSAMVMTMNAIVSHQRDFFLSGNKSDLHPLQQTEIAEETGFDNSTISRIVKDKYVSTSFGTLSLKEFFSFAVSVADGGTVAQVAVKEQLKQLIEQEDKKNPLTDEELTRLLQEKGVKVLRKVVSNYRNDMGILDSRKRKEK